MIHFIYALTTYIFLPIAIIFWVTKGILNKTYWDRIGQRFGWGYPVLDSETIWIHAVSVGEVQATIPLVSALKNRFPERKIVITTVTPTGSDQVKKIYKDQVVHCYIPFETSFSVRNFFNALKPTIALIMETEIWPNLYRECGQRNIILVLVSAKISTKSLKSYKRLLPLFRETLSHGILIAAQTLIDAERFVSLGADEDKTWVMGNIKFDLNSPLDTETRGINFRYDHFQDRPVWIAASTHQGEEEIILNAHKEILSKVKNMLLILVPRHPERFLKVEQILKKDHWNYVSRTSDKIVTKSCEVFLGDTMGELLLFYATSDIAFVGGSLIPIGGHNLLEPASLGLPVLTGIHMFEQRDMVDLFIKEDAAIFVKNELELASKIIFYHENKNKRDAIGDNVKKIVLKNGGALNSLMRRLDLLLTDEAN
ncbi:lipid IV(A) 3-deoxy-D-manno-octulosonic acid transferase [Woeseiaceae bacterium]|nr:lipid IV(A) 3-deoxy-D-manno-octulosonic acid transferase [Woeseiaceae bacterium]